MAHDKKLTKEILLNALGKTEDTLEVQKLFQILGEADKLDDVNFENTIFNGKRYSYVDAEDGRYDYSWDKYGISLKFIDYKHVTLEPIEYEVGQVPELATIFLYIKPDTEWGYESCLPICNEPRFYEGLTIDDILKVFGEPQKIWSSERKNTTRYTYNSPKGFEKSSIQFSFSTDTKEIFIIVITLKEK